MSNTITIPNIINHIPQYEITSFSDLINTSINITTSNIILSGSTSSINTFLYYFSYPQSFYLK